MTRGMTRREICYPTPETEIPVRGTRYYIPSILLDGLVGEFLWTGDELDLLHFERGLVHLSAEEALLHAREMIGIGGN